MRAILLAMLLAGSVFAQSDQRPSRVFVVNKAANTVSVVNGRSFAVEHTIAVGRGPHELAIAPNGLKAYVPNTGDNTISVVDLKTHAAVKTISSPDFAYPHGVAFTGDSRRALVTSERVSKIVVIDVTSDTVVRSIVTDQGGTHMVVIDKAGTWAYLTNRESNTVSFFDLKELKIAANVHVGRGGEGIALSPNEKEVWVSNLQESTLSVVDVARRETVATIPTGQSPFRVAFTPDGKHALAASNSGLNVYDTATRKQVANIPVRGATGVIVATDGKSAFVSCGGANEVQIVDTATWAATGKVAVGRSPDGLAYR